MLQLQKNGLKIITQNFLANLEDSLEPVIHMVMCVDNLATNFLNIAKKISGYIETSRMNKREDLLEECCENESG